MSPAPRGCAGRSRARRAGAKGSRPSSSKYASTARSTSAHVVPGRSAPNATCCAATVPQGLAVVDGKRVAVVVPAHDEERLIGTTLAGIPEFVDPHPRRRRRLHRRDGRARSRDRRRPSPARQPGAQRRRRRRDRDRLRSGARRGDRRHVRDCGGQPDGPGRPAHPRRAGRAVEPHREQGELAARDQEHGVEQGPALSSAPRARGT